MKYSFIEKQADHLLDQVLVKTAQTKDIKLESTLSKLKKLIRNGNQKSKKFPSLKALYDEFDKNVHVFISSNNKKKSFLLNIVDAAEKSLERYSDEIKEINTSPDKEMIADNIKNIKATAFDLSNITQHISDLAKYKYSVKEKLFILKNPNSPEAKRYRENQRNGKDKNKQYFESLSNEEKEISKDSIKSQQDKSIIKARERLKTIQETSSPQNRKEEIRKIVETDKAESTAKLHTSIVKDPNELKYSTLIIKTLELLDIKNLGATKELERYFIQYEKAKANRKKYQKGTDSIEWKGTVLGDLASVQNNFSTFLDVNKPGQFVDWSFNYLLMPSEIYGSYIRKISKLKRQHIELLEKFKEALKVAGLRTAKDDKIKSLVTNVSEDIRLEQSLTKNKQNILDEVKNATELLKNNSKAILVLEESKKLIIKNITEKTSIKIMQQMYTIVQQRSIIGEIIVLAKKGIFGSQEANGKLIPKDTSEKAQAIGTDYIKKLVQFKESLNDEPLNENSSIKNIIQKLKNIINQLAEGLNS